MGRETQSRTQRRSGANRPRSLSTTPRTRVFVARARDGANSVAVIDGTTGAADRIRLGADVHGIAVDAARGVFYVTAGRGALAVIDQRTSGIVQKIPTGANPNGVVVNPPTVRWWSPIPTAATCRCSPSRATVLDRLTGLLVVDSVSVSRQRKWAVWILPSASATSRSRQPVQVGDRRPAEPDQAAGAVGVQLRLDGFVGAQSVPVPTVDGDRCHRFDCGLARGRLEPDQHAASGRPLVDPVVPHGRSPREREREHVDGDGRLDTSSPVVRAHEITERVVTGEPTFGVIPDAITNDFGGSVRAALEIVNVAGARPASPPRSFASTLMSTAPSVRTLRGVVDCCGCRTTRRTSAFRNRSTIG